MMKLLLLTLLATAPTVAQAQAPPVQAPSVARVSHARWEALLKRHVRGGVVDYAGLRATGHPELLAYLAELSAVSSMAGWSRTEKIAFWVNAYNAWTVELVLRNPGIGSIKDITWFSSPWKIALAPFEKLGRGTLSLDDIEHGILRKEFPDPRLHMALVCASISCPALRSEAYVAERLEAQLDDQARTFLRDPTKNQVDLAAGELRISKIFSWYEGDFAAAGGVPTWIARFLAEPEAARVRSGSLTIVYQTYDWSLNGK